MKIHAEAKFSAAHRLLNDDGKCHYLHGHTWRVEVGMTGAIDSSTDMLADFREIKSIVGMFDHTVILNSADPLVEMLKSYANVYRMPKGWEPTAERIACHIKAHFDPRLQVVVRVWESEDCYAES